MNPARNDIPLRWVKRLVSELSPDEIDHINQALGGIPMEPDFGGIARLWEGAKRGTVQLYILPGADGIEAATFFELQTLADGSRNFHSLATVALGQVRRLAEMDVSAMERVAFALGCASLSLGTIRPGLVQTLCEKHGWYAAEIICRKQLTR